MTKDPRQDIYDTLWQLLERYAKVYDFLPPRDTAYPFIRVDAYSGDDRPNKTQVFGDYFQMLHFFWKKEDRIDLTDTLTRVKEDLRRVIKTPAGYQISDIQIREQVIPEAGEDTIQLLHGVLVVTIQFN